MHKQEALIYLLSYCSSTSNGLSYQGVHVFILYTYHHYTSSKFMFLNDLTKQILDLNKLLIKWMQLWKERILENCQEALGETGKTMEKGLSLCPSILCATQQKKNVDSTKSFNQRFRVHVFKFVCLQFRSILVKKTNMINSTLVSSRLKLFSAGPETFIIRLNKMNWPHVNKSPSNDVWQETSAAMLWS